MKIYTKTGDEGKTSLLGGTRVLKSEARIESYGTIDELNSHLGLLRDQSVNHTKLNELLEIQSVLFTIGSHLATGSDNLKIKLPELKKVDVVLLEKGIDLMQEELEELTSFILPGGHSSVSFGHIARCVCRRAERCVVRLSEQEIVDSGIVIYLNRLSDYLFVLCRWMGFQLKVNEIPWKP